MIIAILISSILVVLGVTTYARTTNIAQLRVSALFRDEDIIQENTTSTQWETPQSPFSSYSTRLGQAGYITSEQRTIALGTAGVMYTIPITLLFLLLGLQSTTLLPCIFFGTCIGTILWILFLKRRTSRWAQEALFQLPLILEELILLVESGLGIIPALDKVTLAHQDDHNLVISILRQVNELTASGTRFGTALEEASLAIQLKPLQHTLLHLDISNSEGGRLIPSLRSLSRHAYAEWKISVETRVRRLENLVVFPVFTSVIGLLLLTAAVPLVSVLDFSRSLAEKQKTVDSHSQQRKGNAQLLQRSSK